MRCSVWFRWMYCCPHWRVHYCFNLCQDWTQRCRIGSGLFPVLAHCLVRQDKHSILQSTNANIYKLLMFRGCHLLHLRVRNIPYSIPCSWFGNFCFRLVRCDDHLPPMCTNRICCHWMEVLPGLYLHYCHHVCRRMGFLPRGMYIGLSQYSTQPNTNRLFYYRPTSEPWKMSPSSSAILSSMIKLKSRIRQPPLSLARSQRMRQNLFDA